MIRSCWQIRPWKADDVEDLYRLVRVSLPELGAWLPWCRPDYSRRDTAGWIAHCRDAWAARSEFPMGVFEASTGAVCGGVGINRIDPTARCANLGYWTGTPWSGRGVARAAATQAATFAFDELALLRLEILVHPDNSASRRVAEAIGARFMGVFPERLTLHDRETAAAVYQIEREGWSG